jgi:hypothetical protein
MARGKNKAGWRGELQWRMACVSSGHEAVDTRSADNSASQKSNGTRTFLGKSSNETHGVRSTE